MSSDLAHIRSALAYRSPRLRALLGEVLDVAERDRWNTRDRTGQAGSSLAGTFGMQVALEALDDALDQDDQGEVSA